MSGRVLVCGGRDYDDRQQLFAILDNQLYNEPGSITRLIQGGASGADHLARVWCCWRLVEYENYPADWKTYGRAAGPLRNARMIAEGKPDLVIAFAGERGTADMTRKARAAGIPVREIATPTTAAHGAKA